LNYATAEYNDALRRRKEAEEAGDREAWEQQQAPTVEQIISASGLPERMQSWLRQHPHYVTDPARNMQLQKMHNVAEYQAGGEWSDMYYERLEHLLGLRQAPRPSGNGYQSPPPAVQRRSPDRAPVRQQAPSVPFSAPPTREAPSMTTGRAPTRQAPLTPAQREAARFAGISEQEYATQLEKMERLKASGVIRDGQ
jgi:hypothetical protein